MKPSLQKTRAWPYSITAITTFALAAGFWWNMQKQGFFLEQSDDDAVRLYAAYGDFSSEYYRLRHQLDRVLLTQHSDLEMTQFQQNLALFVLLLQQLLEKNQIEKILPPERLGQISIFVEQAGMLLDKSQQTVTVSSVTFRNFSQSLFALQELIDQTALMIDRQTHESNRKRKNALRDSLNLQNLQLFISMLLAVASLLLWLRQLSKTQEQDQALLNLQDQLKHARDDLAVFNHEKQALLAGISNALLPPLHQLLQSPADRQSATEIREKVASINEELTDLLEVAALDSGMGQLKMQDFDFHALLTALTSEMLVASRAKGLLLSLEITTDVPITLHGNAQRIRQILHTLIENAIKHTQTGRIRINAYAAGRRSKKPRLRIDVSDTGPGITSENLPFVFKPSGTTPGQTCANIRQARSLARHMQGDLTVASRPMEGTTFTLDLPLQSASATEHQAP
jgi:signal transduction histidine kinase